MTRVDRHHYDMLVRVKQFGIVHAELFPADTRGARTFAALAAAVDQVSGSLTSHVQGRVAARSGTLSKAAAREALRAALDALARTAKAIAPDAPGLEGKFRQVSGLHDLELLTVGRASLLEAAPLAPQFMEHGLRLADLQEAIEAFEGAARDDVAARETRASAGAGMTAALAAADEALARLDAIVPNTLRDPTLLAAWRVARHVRRSAGSPGPATPAQHEPTTPGAIVPVPPAEQPMTSGAQA